MQTKSVTHMAKWDEIPLELVQKIGEQIYSDEDFIALGQVCRWWRYGMKLAIPSRTPWLVFADELPCTSKCRLYHLYHGTIQHLELPNLGGDCNYFSTRGWLVCVFSERQKIVLIHPTSGRIIQVPLAFPNYRHMWSKFTLLGNPLTTSDYTLGVMSDGKIRLWSSKNNVWILQPFCFYPSLDITFFNGDLYSVNDQGRVKAYNRTKTNDGLTERVVACLPWPSTRTGSAYMVDLAGVLLVILRVVEGKDYMTVSFKVWEVNVKNGKVKKVNNLNNKAVFVGSNSSFFVEASPTYYCKPNCIYFTDDIYYYCRSLSARGLDTGVYDLSCGMVNRDCFQGLPDLRFAKPLWLGKAPPTLSLIPNVTN